MGRVSLSLLLSSSFAFLSDIQYKLHTVYVPKGKQKNKFSHDLFPNPAFFSKEISCKSFCSLKFSVQKLQETIKFSKVGGDCALAIPIQR